MKLVARDRRYQNAAAIDPWTIVHFASGLALGLVRAPARSALGAAIGYEVLEQFLERGSVGRRLFQITGPESLINVSIDLAVFYVGLKAGHRWLRTGEEGHKSVTSPR